MIEFKSEIYSYGQQNTQYQTSLGPSKVKRIISYAVLHHVIWSMLLTYPSITMFLPSLWGLGHGRVQKDSTNNIDKENKGGDIKILSSLKKLITVQIDQTLTTKSTLHQMIKEASDLNWERGLMHSCSPDPWNYMNVSISLHTTAWKVQIEE